MKKLIFNLILLFLTITTYCQEFASIGAEWYYTERHAFSGDITFLKIISDKDTIVDGKTCRVIQKLGNPMCSGRPDTEYMYQEDSVLYFYDTTFNKFQILYDLTKKVNESWIIEVVDIMYENNLDSIKITIDSISSIVINETSLKRLHVTYSVLTEFHPYSYSSIIIEKIGDIKYLFNYYPYSSMACDGNYSDGLRCYEDSKIGFYSTGVADSCNYVYIWTGLNDIKSQTQISLFPNPAQDYVEIEIKKVSEYTAELYDLNGKYLKSTKTFNSNTRLDLSEIENGLYLIVIKEKNQTVGYKKMIKE
jgi:hypothetical protein